MHRLAQEVDPKATISVPFAKRRSIDPNLPARWPRQKWRGRSLSQLQSVLASDAGDRSFPSLFGGCVHRFWRHILT